MVHWPSVTVAVHDWVPSLTVTFPVGGPGPVALAVTPYFTTTPWPTTDGSGSSELIVAVVLVLPSAASAPFRFSGRPETILPLSPASASPPFSSAVLTAATAADGLAAKS